jgi:hypothetical protein
MVKVLHCQTAFGVQQWCPLVFEYGNVMKRIAIILSGFVCFGALSGVADDARKSNPYIERLKSIAPAELPAEAARQVKKAKARDWSVTTVDVVKAALQASPASACAVVNSVAKAVPEMAPVAAGTAAELQPRQAVVIAKAAAAAAPSKGAKIVVAVSRAVPNSYRVVAVAVCDAVPGSNEAILSALSLAFPELKKHIDEALANYTGDRPSVGVILDQAGALSLASSSDPTDARGPAVGAPLVPITATPGNVDPALSSPVPAGQRTYSSP